MSSCSSAEDEYDSDEPPQLHLDLAELKSVATKALGIECAEIKRLTRGSFHEIFVLKFKVQEKTSAVSDSLARARYSCIGRFARTRTSSMKDASECATIQYLKQHTSIPVPEIYHQNFDPDNEVGAAFTLMERLPGRHLYKTWDNLSFEHKKLALGEIATVISQLASVKFNKIGCLTPQGEVGPLISPSLINQFEGPFDSSLAYLQAFVPPDLVSSPELADKFRSIQEKLSTFAAKPEHQPLLKPPFVMIHADFDAQNMLFSDATDESGPKLTGIIDFEYAHTGPVYFLYEYPIFIQDISWSEELYAENALLRAHFVGAIFQTLSGKEARETLLQCINLKNYTLNRFTDAFMLMKPSDNLLSNVAAGYLEDLENGTGLAYSGRLDYTPEYYGADGLIVRGEDPEANSMSQ